MKYYVSDSIMEGQPAGCAIRGGGDWMVFSHADLKNPLRYNDGLLHEIEPGYFTASQPELAQALTDNVDAELYVDPKTGQLNINTNHQHSGFYDDSARASHQVNLKVGWWQIIKGKKGFLGKMVFITLVILFLCVTVSWLFLFYLLRVYVTNVISMQSVHNIMLSGSLDPGLVVCDLPLRIAVLTNLSLYGTEKYPVLRVIDTMLPLSYLEVGTKVPVSGGYQSIDFEQDKPYWDFYEPTPLANYADVATTSRKAYEIPQYQWDELYEAAKQLPKDPAIGYYTVRTVENAWKKDAEFRFYDQAANIYGDNGTHLGSLDDD